MIKLTLNWTIFTKSTWTTTLKGQPTQQNTRCSAIPGQCTHTSSLTQPNNRHTSQTIMIRWISNCSIFIKIDVKIYNSCLHIVDKYSDCWCIDLWQRHNLGSFDTLEGGRPELCLLVVVRTRSFFSETGPKIKSVHQNSSSVHCFVFVVGLFFTRTELRPWSCSGCSFITRRRPLKTVRETLQRQRF